MLKQNIIPQSYEIFYKPNLKEYTFEANEKIVFTSKDETLPDCITVHGKNFDIKKEQTILQIGSKEFPCTEIKQDEELDTVSFFFGDEANNSWKKQYQNNPESSVVLKTTYNGKIVKTLEGFYRASYDNLETNEKDIMFEQKPFFFD